MLLFYKENTESNKKRHMIVTVNVGLQVWIGGILKITIAGGASYKLIKHTANQALIVQN